MDFTGIFNTVWGWVIASVGGVSLAGILTTILWAILKSSFNRTIEKANLERTQEVAAEKAADKAVSKIKSVSYKQSLQPVVESQLKKVTEEAQEMVKAELQEVNDNYNKLLAILEALSKYFDNSIGVSDSAKAELKNAIAEAKSDKTYTYVEEEVKVNEIKEEPKEDSPSPVSTAEPTKSSKVER